MLPTAHFPGHNHRVSMNEREIPVILLQKKKHDHHDCRHMVVTKYEKTMLSITTLPDSTRDEEEGGFIKWDRVERSLAWSSLQSYATMVNWSLFWKNGNFLWDFFLVFVDLISTKLFCFPVYFPYWWILWAQCYSSIENESQATSCRVSLLETFRIGSSLWLCLIMHTTQGLYGPFFVVFFVPPDHLQDRTSLDDWRWSFHLHKMFLIDRWSQSWAICPFFFCLEGTS